MIFYEGTSLPQIVEDNATVSLENVNEWNHGIWNALPRDERHDVAVWLTRLNIGGPSGYAPVSGACDPERSCSLNRDEGLSSAFILAHELGHILGLSHDGDLGAGNSCKKESGEGSVMAPMVAATFSYFHWSSCSAGEYHYKSDEWKCLRNKPKKGGNYTLITEKIEYEYSLDDQCGMEFDRGFSFCRSFQLPDPCEHLWCAHQDSPQLCKTKKGPPMDGTACGKEKWCVNGHCESTSKNIGRSDGLKHNSLDGSWGSWSRWGGCSRTCGAGISFRSRACNNPRPTYGGQACRGKNEEFKLCNINRCIKGGDVRAEQCQSEFYMASTRSNKGLKPRRKQWRPKMFSQCTVISEGTNLKEEELRQQNGFPTKLWTQSTSASCPASTGSSNPTTRPPRMSSTAPPVLTTTRATCASKASVFESAATGSWAPRCRRTCAESVEATALNAQFRCAHCGKESTGTSAR